MSKSDNRAAIVEDAKDLAERRGVSLSFLLMNPDQEMRTLLSRASEAGATHDIERAASSSR